jgi:hypothetical protein
MLKVWAEVRVYKAWFGFAEARARIVRLTDGMGCHTVYGPMA